VTLNVASHFVRLGFSRSGALNFAHFHEASWAAFPCSKLLKYGRETCIDAVFYPGLQPQRKIRIDFEYTVLLRHKTTLPTRLSGWSRSEEALRALKGTFLLILPSSIAYCLQFVHADDAAEVRDGQDKMRRMDERKGHANEAWEVRKGVGRSSSKVTAPADAGVESDGRSRFGCDARQDGLPHPGKVESAPSTFDQREGRPTLAGPRQTEEEERKANWVDSRTDGAASYKKRGAHSEASSRETPGIEKAKGIEPKKALRGRASLAGTGPAEVGAKANTKRNDGASPQESREASPQSVGSESKNAEMKLDQKGGVDDKQCGRQERTEYIIRRAPRCKKVGCTRRAYYGYRRGSSRLVPERCCKHNKQDMARMHDNVCEVEECFTSAIYALPGAKVRARCGQHKEKGMINIRAPTCEVEGCLTLASFRRSLSETKSTRCSAHKEEGMAPRNCCKMDGCTSHPSFGYAGKGVRTYCKKHKKTGMVYQPHKCDATGHWSGLEWSEVVVHISVDGAFGQCCPKKHRRTFATLTGKLVLTRPIEFRNIMISLVPEACD
jgi:hypothetical protein